MFQKRSLWSIGVIMLMSSLAVCQQAEEPTAQSGKKPGVSQPQQKKRVTKPAAPSKAAPGTSQPAQKAAAPAPLNEFLQKISMSAPLRTMKVGKQVTILVTVKNTGKETWSAAANAAGLNSVMLGGKWLDKSGKGLTGGAIASLLHDLEPGQSVLLNPTIQAPAEAGDYILRLSMFQHGVVWFDERGGKPLDFPVTVVP